MDPMSVLTWACVVVFITTAIVTLLALVGQVTLGGKGGTRHSFYLKALFSALILEVVGISVTAYSVNVKNPGLVDPKKSGGDSAAAPLSPSTQVNWVDTDTLADWVGRDYAYTENSRPKYQVKNNVLCDSTKIGYVATCWEARPDGYPNVDLTDIPTGTKPAQWCTYKDSRIKLSTPRDGQAPVGRIYICAASVPR